MWNFNNNSASNYDFKIYWGDFILKENFYFIFLYDITNSAWKFVKNVKNNN